MVYLALASEGRKEGRKEGRFGNALVYFALILSEGQKEGNKI